MGASYRVVFFDIPEPSPTLSGRLNHFDLIYLYVISVLCSSLCFNFRISYHGVRVYDCANGMKNEDIVLKEFKHVGRGRDRREDYIGIMETQTIAAAMAETFNRIAPKGSKEIEFLNVSNFFL